jgi:CRP/FNR family cyclic AMP-dependent transcriptional regulator
MPNKITGDSTGDRRPLDFRAKNPAYRLGSRNPAFDADAFLGSAGDGRRLASYRPGGVIFSLGDVADSVMYLKEGTIKLSVTSYRGKEAVVAILDSGDFFGESVLAGRPDRSEAATAITATTVLTIPKEQMIQLLHDQHTFSALFIKHMLARNSRIEDDLVDQMFNSSEKRLARVLFLLAHSGKPGKTSRVLPRISQQTLAEMVGTTRSRVNFFMNKFKKLGFIEYRGGLTINPALLTFILYNERPERNARRAG